MNNNFIKIQALTKQLLEQEKYSEVLKILNEELKNPIYSLSQQQTFSNQKNSLEKFIKQINEADFIERASKQNLIKLFLSNYEIGLLEQIFTKFEKEITKNDLIKLNHVFVDEQLDNDLKVNFLNVLKDFNVDFEFDFYNSNLKKNSKINPKNDFSLINNAILYSVAKQIEALYFKETSKETAGNQIIGQIYTHFFNHFDLIPYKAVELADHICNLVEYSFDNKYQVDQKFLNWVKNILS